MGLWPTPAAGGGGGGGNTFPTGLTSKGAIILHDDTGNGGSQLRIFNNIDVGDVAAGAVSLYVTGGAKLTLSARMPGGAIVPIAVEP